MEVEWRSDGKGARNFEIEMAGDEIGHGAQTAEGPKAAGLAFDGLEDAIEGFGGGVGDAGLEVGDDAVPVGADARDQALQFWNTAAQGPGAPPPQGGLCLLGIGLWARRRNASKRCQARTVSSPEASSWERRWSWPWVRFSVRLSHR